MGGDANCDLLTKNPKGEALSAFCACVNATQLIDEPTRVTKTTRSLLDVVVIVSNQGVVKSSGVLQLTISDHFLVYVKLNLKTPRQAPNNMTTPSFRHYKANHFSSDVAHIPWGSVHLKNTAEEQLDAFNDLFVTCLDQHAPLKPWRLRRRPNPVINEEIKDLITSRNDLLKKYRRERLIVRLECLSRSQTGNQLKIRQAEARPPTRVIQVQCGRRYALHFPINQDNVPSYTKDTDTLANEFNKFFISVG